MKKMTKDEISDFTERLCDALPNKMEMAGYSWPRRWDAYRYIIPAVVAALGLRDDTDPDLIEARKIVSAEYWSLLPVDDDGQAMKVALAAIRKGRAMERGE